MHLLDRRLWFGKNAYNPSVLAKLVEIFRTYFNYCEVGEDKRTPAMRMGLARGPVAEEDILYFVPGEPPRQRAPSSSSSPRESPHSTRLEGQSMRSRRALSNSLTERLVHCALFIYSHPRQGMRYRIIWRLPPNKCLTTGQAGSARQRESWASLRPNTL